jgi:hypothetical protein
MLQILDPHLRPVPPAPMEATSQKIYDDHMKLAQEYFKVNFMLLNLKFSRFSHLFSSIIRIKLKLHILQNTRTTYYRI